MDNEEMIQYIEEQRNIYSGAMRYLKGHETSYYYYTLACKVDAEMKTERRNEVLCESLERLRNSIKETVAKSTAKRIFDKAGEYYHD